VCVCVCVQLHNASVWCWWK